jgi:hypothetical protein
MLAIYRCLLNSFAICKALETRSVAVDGTNSRFIFDCFSDVELVPEICTGR